VTLQMKSGTYWNHTFLPRRSEEDRGSTAPARSSTLSSTSSRVAASGVCCRGTFHPERPCSTTSGDGASMAFGSG
jgi:hypothetical protein